jgi:hypothetical protein
MAARTLLDRRRYWSVNGLYSEIAQSTRLSDAVEKVGFRLELRILSSMRLLRLRACARKVARAAYWSLIWWRHLMQSTSSPCGGMEVIAARMAARIGGGHLAQMAHLCLGLLIA